MMSIYKPSRCLILDDHPLICESIKQVISNTKFFSQVEAFLNPKDALNYIQSNIVSLVILDVSLGKINGFDFYHSIKKNNYDGKVIFISAEESALYAKMAIKQGANGFLTKSESIRNLTNAVESVMSGYNFFRSDLLTENTDVKLSNREFEVMNYLIDGYSNNNIADELSLSPKTVSTYKSRILEKHCVDSLVDLIKIYGNKR